MNVLTPMFSCLMTTGFLISSTFWLFPGGAIFQLFDLICFFLRTNDLCNYCLIPIINISCSLKRNILNIIF